MLLPHSILGTSEETGQQFQHTAATRRENQNPLVAWLTGTLPLLHNEARTSLASLLTIIIAETIINLVFSWGVKYDNRPEKT